jgi:hypothetical protein
LQSDLEELSRRSVKPFIDFDHTGKAAAADPKRFVWKPGAGVFLQLNWTRSGRAAIEGKDYRYFEPAIRVDGRGNIEGLPSNGAIGALVNKALQTPVAAPGPRSASALEASQAVERADPYARMMAQRKAVADYRTVHPGMSTDEVFRCLKQQHPEFLKD